MLPFRQMAVLLLALGAACGGEPPTGAPRLDRIDPESGFGDRLQTVVLHGGGFVPSFEIDTMSGRRSPSRAGAFSGRVGEIALADIEWRSAMEMRATIGAGLAAGLHTVEICDAEGRRAVLAGGYRSLGPDLGVPVVRIDAPSDGAPIRGGTEVTIEVTAEDAAPGGIVAAHFAASSPSLPLTEKTKSPASPQTSLTTSFSFEAPDASDGEIIEILIRAVDDAPARNTGEARLRLAVRHAPRVLAVEPGFGPTGGGNSVVVRGHGFVTGARAALAGALLLPEGGVVIDENTIAGEAPAGAAGRADVTVTTVAGEGTLRSGYLYVEPPRIRAVTPARGSVDGGKEVAIVGERFTGATAIYFGRTLDAARSHPLGHLRRLSATLIEGFAPSSPTAGPVHVWAVEPGLGAFPLENGFEYLRSVELHGIAPPEGRQAGGTAVTVRGAGFIDGVRILVRSEEGTFRPLASLQRASDTVITGIMPPGKGRAEVRAYVDGTLPALLPGAFTYRPPPVVNAIDPPYGPARGGVRVVIRGSGFLGPIRVQFADRDAPEVTPVDPGHLSVVLPAGLPGAVPVVVATAFGNAVLSAPGGFEYRGGADAVLFVVPTELVPGDSIAVFVEGETDLGDDVVMVTARSGADRETLPLPRGAALGSFLRSVSTSAGAPVSGDGVIQVAPDDGITFEYHDAFRADGGEATLRATATALAARGRDDRRP